ncbi:MAG: hypothetical protein IBJ03_18235 [Gemmatimonadaceae bacterium]|nr:hypothetical protein [Gemmatimonadaceae bacterium]
MTSLSVETYISLLVPFDKEWRSYVVGIEAELLGLQFDVGSKLSDLMDLSTHTVEAHFFHVNGMEPDSYAPLGLSPEDVEQRLRAVRAGAVLHLSGRAEVEIPEERSFEFSDGAVRVMDRRKLEAWYSQEFVRAMNGTCATLALALNLARPGVFDVGPSFSTDGAFVESEASIISNIPLTAKAAQESVWPKFTSIPIEKVWNWITEKDYVDSMGETGIGRAFNAYSRLFSRASSSAENENLFWALMGLEALFCDGTAGSMSQVVSRSQLLLGAHAPLKKAFARAYGVRSAFIHGGRPFPGQFFQSDGLETFEHFSQTTVDALATTAQMLVGSLRELIVRDWHSLEFTTQLEGS